MVRRGDTLWAIARQHLGPGATDAEVAQEWPRWHHANRAVIGPDPDRLLPGMVLQRPGTRRGAPVTGPGQGRPADASRKETAGDHAQTHPGAARSRSTGRR